MFAVSSLMYVMVCKRLDISHITGVVSRFLPNPDKDHWQVVKCNLRYLKDISRGCLCFGSCNHVLDDYTNACMIGDIDFIKSIVGYVMTFTGDDVFATKCAKVCYFIYYLGWVC